MPERRHVVLFVGLSAASAIIGSPSELGEAPAAPSPAHVSHTGIVEHPEMLTTFIIPTTTSTTTTVPISVPESGLASEPTMAPVEVPTTTTTTVPAPDSMERCLTTDEECLHVAEGLFSSLIQDERYSWIDPEAPLAARYKAFQEKTGLANSGYPDASTIKVMMLETERLAAEPYTYDIENPGEADLWSREDLVKHLFQMDAFRDRYLLSEPTVTDLLNPEITKDELVAGISRLTHYAASRGIGFDILMLNSGHPRTTSSGNPSQHPAGEAIDLRPRNGTESLPTWPLESQSLPTPDMHIITYPEAYAAGVKLQEFFVQDGAWWQMITTHGPYAIHQGRVYENTGADFWTKEVAAAHPEHLHAGIIAMG